MIFGKGISGAFKWMAWRKRRSSLSGHSEKEAGK